MTDMLIVADFLPDLERRACLRAEHFIAAAGGLDYCIAPRDRDCPPGGLMRAHYADEPFHDSLYATSLELAAADGIHTLRTPLRKALFLAALLADQPEWQTQLRQADGGADDEAVVRGFGIDPGERCRARVKAWSAGTFLAPDEQGYTYFGVEPTGELYVISTSPTVLPVAFHMAADAAMEEVGLLPRLSKTQVPPGAGER